MLLPAATSPDPSVREDAIRDCERFLASSGEQAPVMKESVEMLFRVIDLHWQLQRDIASTEVILAMAEYRLDHAAWPETLDQLVPDYLDAIPINPVTGDPFEYDAKPDGPPSLERLGL